MENAPADAARELETTIRDSIPLARAIDLTVAAWDGRALAVDAPLAPNINDKGCAFGGSLASVMTLAGWSLVVLMLQQRGLACDVFVARSEVLYLAPVWQDFRAIAELDADADPGAFLRTLEARGKARIAVHCEVRERDGDTRCATLAARFVARKREPDSGNPAADAAQ